MILSETQAHPLELRWHELQRPLPTRFIKSRRRHESAFPGNGVVASVATGPLDRPFYFCAHISRLAEDVVKRMPDFRHIHIPRILIGGLQARNGHPHGLQARVTPLRFAHGQLQRRRRGTTFQVQRYFLGDHEFLYLMTFCLPRFLDQGFDEKFITLFHELYHIGPEFNGDLRRHHGRCQLHTHSQRQYDRHMARLARDYLAGDPDPNLHSFMRLNFNQLLERHGSVAAVVVPRPKMIPIYDVR